MLTCYRTRRRLGAWLDGALDEATARSTAAHVAGCGVCQRETAELRRLHTVLGQTLAVAEPDWTGFWPGVVRAVEDRRELRPVRAARGWWRPQWAVGGALATALLVTLGVWQYLPTTVQSDGVTVSSASTGDPRATVLVYGTPERDVAVVWILGLED